MKPTSKSARTAINREAAAVLKRTKPSKLTRKIITDAGVCTQHNHREAVTSCPFCQHEPAKGGRTSDSYRWWVNAAHTLVAAEVWGKHEYVAVITECPSCFKSSWVHWGLTSFSYMDVPDAWKKAIEKEGEQRHLAAIRTWSKGICQFCVHLRKVELKTACWKHCTLGSERKLDGRIYLQGGPPAVAVGTSMLKNQCDQYKPVPGAPDWAGTLS